MPMNEDSMYRDFPSDREANRKVAEALRKTLLERGTTIEQLRMPEQVITPSQWARVRRVLAELAVLHKQVAAGVRKAEWEAPVMDGVLVQGRAVSDTCYKAYMLACELGVDEKEAL